MMFDDWYKHNMNINDYGQKLIFLQQHVGDENLEEKVRLTKDHYNVQLWNSLLKQMCDSCTWDWIML